MSQKVFKRYEYKYLIDASQKEALLGSMKQMGHMCPDTYGRTTVRSLYFDTPDFYLIRRSIEKPAYKEKLRLRAYARADKESPVFVELKKKYKHIVYKRRVELPEGEAMCWLCTGAPTELDGQIPREIDYFLSFYKPLSPAVFLSYEREAFFSPDTPDLRITLDENILCRTDGLTLEEDARGESLLPEGKTLLEIKASGGMPLWLASLLSKEAIRRTSFSKYGLAYQTLIHPNIRR